MPILGVAHLLVAVGFVLYAHRTGRPPIWMFVLLMVPFVGSIAYILFEVLPELASSRRARKVGADLRTAIDPDRNWRQLADEARQSGTVDAITKLARECERKDMWEDALEMYQQAAQGLFSDDPDIARGLARAQLGTGNAEAALATLDALRQANPEYQHQDAHLTYARSLEMLGKLHEADEEYRALICYFVGTEARTRYALFLQRRGETSAARTLFDEVAATGKARGVLLADDDRKWIKVARRNT